MGAREPGGTLGECACAPLSSRWPGHSGDVALEAAPTQTPRHGRTSKRRTRCLLWMPRMGVCSALPMARTCGSLTGNRVPRRMDRASPTCTGTFCSTPTRKRVPAGQPWRARVARVRQPKSRRSSNLAMAPSRNPPFSSTFTTAARRRSLEAQRDRSTRLASSALWTDNAGFAPSASIVRVSGPRRSGDRSVRRPRSMGRGAVARVSVEPRGPCSWPRRPRGARTIGMPPQRAAAAIPCPGPTMSFIPATTSNGSML